ncbi:MAG: LysM domain-containing protein [Rubritalea sp.]|uniref:LysM peptidoglycan-binding domain-containing protein n=1 Tax=Rubritalea sp. TaxID=2109375 RepID=UPI0032428295
MRFSTLIRFFAAITVLSALAITLVIAKRSLLKSEEKKQPANRLEALIPANEASAEAVSALVAKLEVENLPDVTPGERAFESARELLVKRDYIAAEEKLKYVNTYYPTAMSAPEARRILGEMNMDRLFSGRGFAELKQYKVKRGDSFFKIIRDNQTNLDLLMYLNNLKRIDRLHPGDVLTVMPLNFRLVIDIPRKVLGIWDGIHYIKGYEIKYSSLAKGAEVKETQLMAVEAQSEDGRVTLPSSKYRSAEKVLVLKSPQAEIRPYVGKPDEGIVGLYLDAVDLEELALLLRSGNSVEIRY